MWFVKVHLGFSMALPYSGTLLNCGYFAKNRLAQEMVKSD